MTPQEFINWLTPKLANIPVLKSLAIAQICLESRYGKKHFYNNYLGIKCHNPNKYAGCRLGKTSEYIDGSYSHNLRLAFQTYHNIEENIEDYSRLMNISRYKPVRESTDYLEATEQIRKCGYATSPTYQKNLRKIIEKYKLYELDSIMDKDTQLTQHFKWGEFWCRNIEPPEEYYDNILLVATELEKLRGVVGKPIRINSAYRTPTVNKLLGGSKNSKHLTAEAADIRVIGFPNNEVGYFAARYTHFQGFGIGRTYTHLDTRDKFAIWFY